MEQAHAFNMDSYDEQPSESKKSSEPFSLLPLGDDLEDSDAAGGREPSHVDEVLREAVLRGSSDIHLSVGLPPVIRIDGRLVRTEYAALNGQQIQRMVYDILTKDQILWLEKSHELDFSYGLSEVGRFRVNVYRQRGSLGAAFRAVPSDIPSFEKLRLPAVTKELTTRASGLILVTGPTGAGKSTTIASMIDHINTQRPVHIMTIEDPIEYLHRHKMGMVNQRELNQDTDSFENALRAVLREDPDVILVGEMRDLETISAALTLAETGHLVFGTLHTRNCAQTIDRVIDVFPPHQQAQIRVQLANTLEAVISQLLLPMTNGGRVAAHEVMVATSAIRNLIREGKSHQIGTLLETGQDLGMQPMDRALVELHRHGLVTLEEARNRATDPENFDRYRRGN